MIRTEVLESQVASYVGAMRLSPEYPGEVVEELRRGQSRQYKPDERGAL
jgi:hypothetical protein